MSSLVKLSISGIRSYDNRGRETLVFSKPLTLIAGPNGVGKTTVIEALKYATTGDMPPNSRGGAFVHDPKMSGERQVLGQVKLGYYNARGQQMVVTRSMQLTQNRKNPTFKTLDGQLLIVANGEKETLSSRCADLDVQVPLSLGVSTSVLDYVIFCHQEDSMWPLSEPSLVKKRFDDIFEATKYSKALDSIKTLRKDYAADIKLQQQSVEYLNQDNERAQRIAKQIDSLAVRIQNLGAEATATKQHMDRLVAQLNTLFKQNQNFQKVISELVQARHTASELESHIKVIGDDLEILAIPVAEIEEQLAGFDDSEHNLQQRASDLAEKYTTLTAMLQTTRERLGQLGRQHGVLESAKNNHELKSKQISDLVALVSQYYSLSVTPEEIIEFLEARITAAQSHHTEYQTQARQDKQAQQLKIDEINARKSALIHKLQSASEQLEAHHSESKSLAREIRDHTSSGAGGNTRYQESLLAELTQQLEQLQNGNTQELVAQIDTTSQNIAVLKQRQEQNNRDLISASSRFNENSRIMVQRDNITKKQYQINDLAESLKAQLPAASKDISEFKKQQISLSEELAALISNRETLSGQLQQASANKQVLEQEHASLTEQIKSIESKLESNGVNVPTFQSTLKEVEEDLEIATQNLEQTTFSTQYYEMAKSQASEHSKCILCQHEFNKSELTDFLQLISSKIASIPITKEDASASLEETRQEAEKLRSLISEYSIWSSISTKLPQVEAKLATAAAEDSQYRQEIADLDKLVALNQQKREALVPILSSVDELQRLKNEVEQMEQELVTTVPPTSSTTASETPQEVQTRIEMVNNELNTAEQQLGKYKESLHAHQQQVSELQTKISNKNLDLKNLELKEQSLKLKKVRIDELKSLATALESSEIPTLESHLEEINKEHQGAITVQSSISDTHIEQERSLLKEVSTAERFLNQVSPLIAETQDYDPTALGTISTEIKQLETKISAIESELKDLDSDIKANDRSIASSRGQKRLLQDNIQLRSYETQLMETKTKIAELEAQNAESERDEFERQTSVLQDELSELSSDHSLKLGQVKSIQEQRAGLEADLASDYADIHQKYYSASTRLDCTKSATDDLQKYATALDGAIMMYHSIKMEEINQVLDELWKDTYMGTDIDTIKVKSEIETTKTRSTHNYRVVMYKQGVELDMRGRCSAGQKLLACVLIRLALSECFGLNCGFLVLDEPTTNLDVANIQSLGRSLARIIETRRVQKNFQLIVITHDEHFLTYLGASNFCDTFFRLHRDSHQHSRIEELPITQLG